MPFEFPDITKITIDWGAILRLADQPFFALMWSLIKNGGWVLFLFLTFWVVAQIITYRAEINKEKNTKYVLLAVDVPKDNLNGPEVTERLFAHLATAGSTGGLKSPTHVIFMRPRFSFEIISSGGRIQFLARMPEEYRDLVEAAFYGEYPNAEIKEIDDYTKEFPNEFPSEQYEMWGSEIVLYNKDMYPIRTYEAFEHKLSGEFRDPMSNFLEVLSRIYEGESIWIQILVTFGGVGWKKGGEKLVNELIGAKPRQEKDGEISGAVGDLVVKGFGSIANFLYESVLGETSSAGPEMRTEREGPHSLITFLSPGEKEVVASIQRKYSKIGFRTKIRIIYLAKKDVYNFHRAVPGVLGALNQFNTLDMNGFKPDDKVKTKASLWSLNPRKDVIKKQNKIIRAYKERSLRRGTNGYILNIEELATVYHFPVVTVEAPLVKKTGSKRGEPPFTLPVKEEF